MEPEIIVVVVAAVLILAVLAVLAFRKRQSRELKQRFGPEYDRTVQTAGDRREAEHELQQRQKRRASFEVKPLPAATRERYLDEWGDVQRRFVDTPDVAVRDAHALVTNVMRDRGYPMADFEQRAADVSVDHPEVVEDYRAANQIATDSEAGRTSTEDLRQAMVHFRSLFDRLLETSPDTEVDR
jgi:hypothetical protein